MSPFFHGGFPGLEVGDFVLPRAQLATWSQTKIAYDRLEASAFGDDGTWVHVTSQLPIARHYASAQVSPERGAVVQRAGDVYRVELVGPPQPDPDFRFWPDVFARVSRARILEVVERRVVIMNPRESTRIMGTYKRWTTGRVYDDDGYLMPSPDMLRAGITASALRALGPWFPLSHISADGRPIKPPPPLLPPSSNSPA